VLRLQNTCAIASAKKNAEHAFNTVVGVIIINFIIIVIVVVVVIVLVIVILISIISSLP